MRSIVRVLLASVAAVLSVYGSLWVSFVLVPATSGVGLLRVSLVLTLAASVTWYVWRHSASASQQFVTAAVIGMLVVALPGWGYWQASTHAYLRVSVNDIARRNDSSTYGGVPAADVIFRDRAGKQLATGTADSRMVHPTIGDCRREEHVGGEAWRQCFDAQSQWFMTWVRQVDHATVRVDTCTIDRVPATLEESRDLWWLWWVPHPHLDNSARTHFVLTMWIDSTNCRPADRPSQVGSDALT
jgi:hypothetical protein